MDKRKALEIIDQMIKIETDATDPLRILRDRITSIKNNSVQPLVKAIQDVEDMVKKSSAVNLDMNEKMKKAMPPPKAAPQPKVNAPKVNNPPSMNKPMNKNKMAKVDPTTHLRGVMLDKNLSSGGMQSGDVGSSNQNLTPGLTKDDNTIGGAPSDAPPMMASEDGKKHMHKHIAKCLSKCMTKSLTASEKVTKADTVIPDTGFGKITIKNESSKKAEVKKAVTGTGPIAKPMMPKPASVSVKMGIGMGKSAANPDEKADAKLGEGVEHMVENHMIANKPAEMKEGHPVASIIQHLHSKKPMMKTDNAAPKTNKDEWETSYKESYRRQQPDGKPNAHAHANAIVFANSRHGKKNSVKQPIAKTDTIPSEHSITPKDMSAEAKRAIVEPKDQPVQIQPNRPGQANKPVEKAEILNKPYRSDAQRRWAHTPTGTKALGGKAAVHEWDESSRGKKLPEKVSKK
jgi:hypothetical protein